MRHLEGFCSDEKAEDMRQLILQEVPLCVVEIGVFGGKSLIPQAKALREARAGVIWGIDPWTGANAHEGEHPPEHVKWLEEVHFDKLMAGCFEAISEEQLWPWVRILAAPARKVCPVFDMWSIDILHIDGNHSEKCSMEDVALYAVPRVKSGGWVWFDDSDYDSTQKAIRYLCEHAEHIQTWPRVEGKSSAYSLYRRR